MYKYNLSAPCDERYKHWGMSPPCGGTKCHTFFIIIIIIIIHITPSSGSHWNFNVAVKQLLPSAYMRL